MSERLTYCNCHHFIVDKSTLNNSTFTDLPIVVSTLHIQLPILLLFLRFTIAPKKLESFSILRNKFFTKLSSIFANTNPWQYIYHVVYCVTNFTSCVLFKNLNSVSRVRWIVNQTDASAQFSSRNLWYVIL